MSCSLKELQEQENFTLAVMPKRAITKNFAVERNMFIYCKDKWENATNRWKEHWFTACEKIIKQCAEYAQYFIVNTIDRTIAKLGELVKKIKT